MDRSSYRSATPDHRIVPQTSWDLRTASPAGDVIQANKSEEWTTSKKTVNHKTRQIETRVQRQLVLEDGKVIADSGPQVSQRTREDNKIEESEDTNHKTSGEPDLPVGYVKIPGSERIIDDKTTTYHTTRESREENIKMHDEDQRHLDNVESVHRLALTGDEVALCDPHKFKGKVTHYSARSKRVTDKDRIKELTEHIDGKANTQKTRTHFHEEQSDDEVPEEYAERDAPAYDSSTSRNFEYLNDGRGKFDYLSDKLNKDRTYLQITQNRHSTDLRHEDDYPRPIESTNRASRWLEDHFIEEDRQRVINVDTTRSTQDSRDCEFGAYHRVADLRDQRDSRHSDIRDSRTNEQRRHETIYTDVRHSDLHLRDSHRDSHLLREDQGHSPIITSPHSTLKSVRNEDYRTHTWRSSTGGPGNDPEVRYTVRSPDSTLSTGSRPSRTFYFGATGHTNEALSAVSPLSAPSLVKKSSFNLRGR
ncbi:uncharacterized protein LOC111262110 [Varroa jacobsoni]|uniref:uncharacterized protein LOC111262110 n=1 Tax=Varroa jacobsoni TaxID=62625 RepID=UPI000BFA6FBB|nr:uncharacterized protein LOC111262110 [Varroa jacobsoni]